MNPPEVDQYLPNRETVATQGRSSSVDTHAHVFQRGLQLASTRRYAPDYDASLDDYLRQLDTNGVARGVLVQPSFLGTDNRFMLDALRRYPQRLRGIAVVSPSAEDAELASMADAGVVGIRLNLIDTPLPNLRSKPWTTLLNRLAKLGWLVELHCEARRLQVLLAPLLEYSVNVVVDHFGRPDAKLGTDDPGFQYLLSIGSTRRVWVKLSGAYRNGLEGLGEATAHAAIPLLRHAFGLPRMLWGSDWPHTQFEKTVHYEQTLQSLDRWLPDTTDRLTVIGDTPTELFKFPI